MYTIAMLVLGAFVGWNFPQPEFAKKVQEKFLDWYNSKFK